MKIPSVCAVSGDQDFLRRRHVLKTIRDQEKNGWRIDRVSGDRPHDVGNALAQGGFLIRDPVLVVIEKPEKAPLDLLEAHFRSGDGRVVALLEYEGNPRKNSKFGKFLMGLGKAHVNFPAQEKQWKLLEAASDFCVNEAKKRGKKMKPELARSLIIRVGYDLGVLDFELLKIATLADIDGSDEIQPVHVAEGLANIAEAAVDPLVNALAARDRKKIVQVMTRLENSRRGDPSAVLGVTRYLQVPVYRWFGAVVMRGRGVNPDQAADILGLNPWFYKKRVFPQASRWDMPGLKKLIRGLALAERAVLNGHVDPWTEFVSHLLRACGSVN